MGRIILPDGYNSPIRAHTGLGGLYRLQKYKRKSGTRTLDTGWFNNLFLDQGLANFAQMEDYPVGKIASVLAVGSGTGAPTVSDTQLENLIAAVSGTGPGSPFPPGPNTQGYVAAADGIPAYWFARFNYEFGTGAAAGNLTEIGTYPGGGSPTALSSRALIVDGNGNPVTVTVLSDEILTATYELRYYLDTTDHAFTFNLNGSPITGVYRPYAVNSPPEVTWKVNNSANIQISPNDIGSITVQPSGDGAQGSLIQIVDDMSVSGTWYADWRATFDTSSGNATNKSFYIRGTMWQIQFGNLSTPIVKTNGQQLQINFRLSWGRYSP